MLPNELSAGLDQVIRRLEHRNQTADATLLRSIQSVFARQSADMAGDIKAMHDKFGVHTVVSSMNTEQLSAFYAFRAAFLQEEVMEFIDAKDADHAVDALIDLIVVAVGTLDLMQVDIKTAWDRVNTANMAKTAGVNPNRTNPLGLPDLVKPDGWTPPCHTDNVGLFALCFADALVKTPTVAEAVTAIAAEIESPTTQVEESANE